MLTDIGFDSSAGGLSAKLYIGSSASDAPEVNIKKQKRSGFIR